MRKQAHSGKIAVIALALAGVFQIAEARAMEIAKVNGRVISDKDLKFALGNLNEGQRDSVLKDPDSRRKVILGLIDQEVLTQEGEREKLDADADYKEAVASFRKQYLANRVLEQNVGSKLTDAAAKKYYQAHKLKYSTDQIHAMHILLRDEKEAQDMVRKAKAPNADFQELAEKFSKDPSAKNNRGDLGFFGRDRMVPEFTDAAFSGKEGEIVGPVKTSYGYHVIKVMEKRIGKPLEYDEVELRVKNDLRQDLMQAYVSHLKQTAKVEIPK